MFIITEQTASIYLVCKSFLRMVQHAREAGPNPIADPASIKVETDVIKFVSDYEDFAYIADKIVRPTLEVVQ